MSDKKEELLSQAFSRFLSGFSLSKAILEDYTKVIARLENTTEKEVKDRVEKRSKEIFEEVLEKQKQQTEESMKKD